MKCLTAPAILFILVLLIELIGCISIPGCQYNGYDYSNLNSKHFTDQDYYSSDPLNAYYLQPCSANRIPNCLQLSNASSVCAEPLAEEEYFNIVDWDQTATNWSYLNNDIYQGISMNYQQLNTFCTATGQPKELTINFACGELMELYLTGQYSDCHIYLHGQSLAACPKRKAKPNNIPGCSNAGKDMSALMLSSGTDYVAHSLDDSYVFFAQPCGSIKSSQCLGKANNISMCGIPEYSTLNPLIANYWQGTEANIEWGQFHGDIAGLSLTFPPIKTPPHSDCKQPTIQTVWNFFYCHIESNFAQVTLSADKCTVTIEAQSPGVVGFQEYCKYSPTISKLNFLNLSKIKPVFAR
jgi:hypothetical protein